VLRGVGGRSGLDKQFAVFLGVVPFVYLILLRRWRLFFKPGIWISTGVFGALVAVLMSLSIPVNGAGVTQAIPAAPIPMYLAYYRLFLRNATFYVSHYREVTGVVGLILLALPPLALAMALWRRGSDAPDTKDEDGSPTFWSESVLYVAWVLASLVVLFLLRPYATRYLFLTHPATIVLAYGSLFRIARRLPGGKRTAVAAGMIITLYALLQFPASHGVPSRSGGCGACAGTPAGRAHSLLRRNRRHFRSQLPGGPCRA
jgi:hypothetical protein